MQSGPHPSPAKRLGPQPPWIVPCPTRHTPRSLTRQLRAHAGRILLDSTLRDSPHSRCSLVAARPFLTFEATGSHCLWSTADRQFSAEADPFECLEGLMRPCTLASPDAASSPLPIPLPLGGAFGFWGYGLNAIVEPRVLRRTQTDLPLPDCRVGFYDSLVVFDHRRRETWIVATGLSPSGAANRAVAEESLAFWQHALERDPDPDPESTSTTSSIPLHSNLGAAEYTALVRRALEYIAAGDIYQVNLARRLCHPHPIDPDLLHARLAAISPAPYAGLFDAGAFQLVSSSPELFLQMTDSAILTRPIKGTRPRASDPAEDARLAQELLANPKEQAELIMITDLLRNDLGRVCAFGSVQVPELRRLERCAQVQHLVATITGRLRPGVTHAAALRACFPGGSVTGAPKVRAMEIIEELEPLSRGPYTGTLGCLGFNRISQLNILIRTAVCTRTATYFHTGAGIVADSDPVAEFDETTAKAAGFVAALAPTPPPQAPDFL